MTVRVRYAPSPTGYQHMGNIRTALFNWLLARKLGGTFILRIEDTDLERSKKEYEDGIIEDLKWLGIEPDESPVKPGEYGPYRQSERLEIYREHADRLVEKGLAYKCFCTSEELEARREKASAEGRSMQGYDNRCRELTPEEQATCEAEGREYSLRFKVPGGKKISVDDEVRGHVEWDTDGIPDFVIMKSDGMPTYHFGVVVDDNAMGITHVLRGRGHLDNTALHVMLYDAFGYEKPSFIHMSHTAGLSKRKGSENIRGYREAGYLPEAVVNYACLLGWYPRDGKEKFDILEAARQFETKDLQKSDSNFDHDKFKWLAAQYIRDYDPVRLAWWARPFFEDAGCDVSDEDRFIKILQLVKPGVETLKGLRDKAGPFYGEIKYESDARKALDSDAVRAMLGALLERVEDMDPVSEEGFDEALSESGREAGLKGKKLFFAARGALIGKTKGPDLKATAALMGKEKLARRITDAMEVKKNETV